MEDFVRFRSQITVYVMFIYVALVQYFQKLSYIWEFVVCIRIAISAILDHFFPEKKMTQSMIWYNL